MNRLIAVKGIDGATTKYSYDALGRRISTDGAKENTVYTYDEVGNLVSQTTTGAYDLALEYAYDLSGRMTSESRTENGATLISVFAYDPLGQLTSFSRSDGQSESYTYDPVGNMTAKTQNGVSTAMRYNAANQLISSVSGTDKTTYTYDANGNLVRSENAGGARSYAYNALNLLESFTRFDNHAHMGYSVWGWRGHLCCPKRAKDQLYLRPGAHLRKDRKHPHGVRLRRQRKRCGGSLV